jgi:regulator of sirC expression with transglutaminase-like and TPR domain
MTDATSHLQAFATLVNTSGGHFPLLECAATVPQYADDGFAPADVVRCVHAWGEQLAARIAADTSATNRLRLLNHFFFDELHFAPGDNDYYSVDNSYLHRVVERRRGIPITLSLLYMEVGRAIGLKLNGVNFPGHFLVRLPVGDNALLIDVYGRGVTLSAEQLQARAAQAGPAAAEVPLELHLRPAPARDILARLLRNLKAIHARGSDWTALLEVQHRLVLLAPDVPEERRDRALAYEKLECPRAAADDLVAYLSLHADPPDAHEIRDRLARLQRQVQRLN